MVKYGHVERVGNAYRVTDKVSIERRFRRPAFSRVALGNKAA
jgi:hypothetical protein